ncbi:MAG: hypothetical protein AAGJ35_06560 [Myxococcota bacterium]
MPIPMLIFGVLLPLLAATAWFCAVSFVVYRWEPAKEGSNATQGSTTSSSMQHVRWLSGGVGVAASYMVAYVGLLGWPSLTLGETTTRMFWLLPCVVAFSVFSSWRGVSKWLSALLWSLLLFGATWWCFGVMARNGAWTLTQSIVYMASVVVAGLSWWWCLQQWAETLTDTEVAWSSMLYGIGTSVLLILSSSAKTSQLVGAAVSALGVWWFASWVFRRWITLELRQSVVPVLVFVLLFGVASGKFEANLSWTSLGVLWGIPILLWAQRSFIPIRSSIWKRMGVQSGLVLVPLGLAVALLLAKQAAPDADDDDAYGWILHPPCSPKTMPVNKLPTSTT